MKLLIHDTLATTPFVLPFQEGWVEGDAAVEIRPALFGNEVGANDAALISSAEIALLNESHEIAPEIAVVLTNSGDIAMRVPVRPDEIDRTPVRLLETSSGAEILARATLQAFYGILATDWTREAVADAEVVIVEGAEALRDAEAGFSEDLARAWFILSSMPFVSHLLALPKGASESEAAEAIALLDGARQVAHERRRDVRRLLAERFVLDRDRLTDYFQAMRTRLEEDDRRALLALLQRGNRGSSYPYPWQLSYRGDAPADTGSSPG